MKAIVSSGGRDVERVLVNAIDLRERFDQVKGVALVASEFRPHRMSIDCDPQSGSPVSLPISVNEREGELLTLCRRSLRVVVLLAAGITLANACGFAAQSAQIVELGAANAASFHEIDMIDDGRVQRKDSFHADAETGFANGDRLTRAAVLARNHDAFESLQSFLGLGFLDPDVNADRVARLKLWNIFP